MRNKLADTIQGIRKIAPADMKGQITRDMSPEELLVFLYMIRRRRWYDRKDMLKNDFGIATGQAC